MTKKYSSDRYENVSAPAHDDMLGILGTGISGANQWNVKNINDTLYPIGFLRNNSNDFAIVRIQSPHWRKQGENLDSIHLHYILDTAPSAGQTALFTTYWTWLYPNQAVPPLTSWANVPSTLTFGAGVPAWDYGIFSLVTNVSAPTSEGYGLYLLCRTVRGNGTYTGEMGVLDMDAHAQKDRLGSNYEAWDIE